MPQRQVTTNIKYGDREISGRILGVTEVYLEIRNRFLVDGQFFTREDLESQARLAYIGQEMARRLFPDSVYPVGQSIRIGNVAFRIAGILNEVGGAGFGPNDDDVLVAPLSTVQTRLAPDRDQTRLAPDRDQVGRRVLTNILVQARDAEDVQAVAGQIRETIREVREINFRDEDNFQIFSQTDLLDSLGNITGLLTVFLAVIAGISLIVGGIGIMNIMLVTVTERTREIGLRKAVGAQKQDILFQFLVEAISISGVGGALGILIATLGTALLSVALPDLEASVQVSSIVLATAISVGIGVFFGIYPANRAASLNPIDALRYE